jgi:hypothetical protein
MALKIKYSICTWFILVLGLVSCSQDTSTTYQPAPVAGQNVGALDSQRKMQWAQDIRELELGGELAIDMLRQQDFAKNPITVRVQSWCRTDTALGDLYSDVYFQNRFSIPVLNVLSPEALLSLSQNPLSCRLVLTLTDSFSSQAIYPLDNITIKNSADFNNMTAFTDSHGPFLYENLKSQSVTSGELQHLMCEDFRKITSFTSSWETLISSSPTDMSTWKKATQLCRLFVKTGETVFLSPRFQLVFAPKELLIRTELHQFSSATVELAPRHIITLRVSNPNSFGVKVRLNNLLKNRMTFVPVYSGMGAVGYIGNQREFPLTWSLQNTPYLVASNENAWIIELPANQEIVVDGVFQGNLHCDSELLRRPKLANARFQSHPNFVGIQYGFHFEIQFQTLLVDEQWQTTNLRQGTLSAMAEGPRPYWNLFYEQVRDHFGRGFQNPARTTADFIDTVRTDVAYDRCVVK